MARPRRRPQLLALLVVAVVSALCSGVHASVSVVTAQQQRTMADAAASNAARDAVIARHRLARRQDVLRIAAEARREALEQMQRAVTTPKAVSAQAPVFLQMQQSVTARVRDERDIDPAAIAAQHAADAAQNAARTTDPNAPKAPPAPAAGVADGNDQLQSTSAYFDSQRGVGGAVPHPLSDGEREYSPEGQLDALLADEQRREQQVQLQQFNARLDTQVLVRRAKQLTAHIAKVANQRTAGSIVGSSVLTPLTAASTQSGADSPRFAAVPSAADALKQQSQQPRDAGAPADCWLGRMRLQSARHADSAAERIAERAAESVHSGTSVQHHARGKQHHRARHLHRNHQTHHLNLGERVTMHNRARGRQRATMGGDGDVEDEKYMATDEAKGQEVEYEPDESSNNWWWDYWAPYIA